MEIETATESVVSLTQNAAEEVKSMLQKPENAGKTLRVYVEQGGCSGMQYGMAFDDNVRPGDEIVEAGGVRVLIDDFSAPYIRGSEIDYVDSLMGAGFTVHNPNAVSSCSCGHSFDTGDDAGSAKGCGCGH